MLSAAQVPHQESPDTRVIQTPRRLASHTHWPCIRKKQPDKMLRGTTQTRPCAARERGMSIPSLASSVCGRRAALPSVGRRQRSSVAPQRAR